MQNDSSKKYVVWFLKEMDEGESQFNQYPVPDLRTAVMILDIYARETSCPPNALGLSVWDEDRQEWLEWDDGGLHDIREFTVNEAFEIQLREMPTWLKNLYDKESKK